jgi:hypothetical protein
MSSYDKCKHKTLSAKAEIIKKLDKDEKLIWLQSMVLDMLWHTIFGETQRKLSVLWKIPIVAPLAVRLQNLVNTLTLKTLYTCFLWERNKHTPISGEIIREKAKYVYKMTLKNDFRALDGWLHKFKKWFGIRFLTIMGEKLSCAASTVDPFVTKFQ